jgi:hypothetical protein
MNRGMNHGDQTVKHAYACLSFPRHGLSISARLCSWTTGKLCHATERSIKPNMASYLAGRALRHGRCFVPLM